MGQPVKPLDACINVYGIRSTILLCKGRGLAGNSKYSGIQPIIGGNMEQVAVYTNEAETRTVTVFQIEGGQYLVEFVEPDVGEEGYFLQAGYYSTLEVATEKAQELLVAESISGEMLVGDLE
jgi:hypothetical protein